MKASSPRLSHRKLHHANAAPQNSPAAQSTLRNGNAERENVAPKAIVSQEIRLSVISATTFDDFSGVKTSVTHLLAGASIRQPSHHFPHTREESYSAKDQHEDRLGVQPLIQEEANQPGEDYRTDQSERQFHRKGRLVRILLCTIPALRRSRQAFAIFFFLHKLTFQTTTRPPAGSPSPLP